MTQSHQPTEPSSRPFLVEVGGNHVLVDAARERLLVLDEAGARAWREFEAGRPSDTRALAAFAAELAGDGLPGEAAGETPRILARVPLQVAAGTSDPNPFSDDLGF